MGVRPAPPGASGRASQASVAIVVTMMAVHGARGRADRAVLFAGGDVPRAVFDPEHSLNSAGDASDHGARYASNHRAGDLGAPLEAVDHTPRDAVASRRVHRYRHQRDRRETKKKCVFHREGSPLLFERPLKPSKLGRSMG